MNNKILEVVKHLCGHMLEVRVNPRTRTLLATHREQRGMTDYSETKLLRWVNIEMIPASAEQIAQGTYDTLVARMQEFIQADENKKIEETG